MLRALRYGGIELGVVGAVGQVYGGIQQIRHARTPHDRVDGVVDLTMGTVHFAASSVTTGSLAAALFGYASWTGAITFAAMFHITHNTLDGSRDIYHGMHHKRGEEVGTGAMKLAGAAIVAAGAYMGSIPAMLAGTALYDGTVLFQNRNAIRSGLTSLWRRPQAAPAT